MAVKRLPQKLKLGQEYWVCWKSQRKTTKCRLIQVTPKGYNLLDLRTDKCLLYPHMYPSKCENHVKDTTETEMYFWINENLIIV